jgi:O-antigen/teichoic acid export membrane protein
VFIRHRQYPKFFLWASLINTTGMYVPIAFLSFAYSTAAVGSFSLSQRVAGLPMLLLGQAVGRVYLSRARQSVDVGAIAENTRRLFRVLTAVAVPYTMLLIVASEDVFVFIFGEVWRDAGSYACVLAPWLLFLFVASPISPLVQVYERQGNEFLFQCGLLLARIVALSTCFWASAPLVPVATFGLVSAACWMARLCWLLQLSGNRLRDCVGDISDILGYSVLLATPLVIVKLFGLGGEIVFFVFLILGVSALSLSIWIVRPLLGLRLVATHGDEA